MIKLTVNEETRGPWKKRPNPATTHKQSRQRGEQITSRSSALVRGWSTVQSQLMSLSTEAMHETRLNFCHFPVVFRWLSLTLPTTGRSSLAQSFWLVGLAKRDVDYSDHHVGDGLVTWVPVPAFFIVQYVCDQYCVALPVSLLHLWVDFDVLPRVCFWVCVFVCVCANYGRCLCIGVFVGVIALVSLWALPVSLLHLWVDFDVLPHVCFWVRVFVCVCELWLLPVFLAFCGGDCIGVSLRICSIAGQSSGSVCWWLFVGLDMFKWFWGDRVIVHVSVWSVCDIKNWIKEFVFWHGCGHLWVCVWCVCFVC